MDIKISREMVSIKSRYCRFDICALVSLTSLCPLNRMMYYRVIFSFFKKTKEIYAIFIFKYYNTMDDREYNNNAFLFLFFFFIYTKI